MCINIIRTFLITEFLPMNPIFLFTRIQLTLFIGIITLISDDFHLCDKIRKPQSPWLCFTDHLGSLRTLFLNPHQWPFSDHSTAVGKIFSAGALFSTQQWHRWLNPSNTDTPIPEEHTTLGVSLLLLRFLQHSNTIWPGDGPTVVLFHWW